VLTILNVCDILPTSSWNEPKWCDVDSHVALPCACAKSDEKMIMTDSNEILIRVAYFACAGIVVPSMNRVVRRSRPFVRTLMSFLNAPGRPVGS